MNPLSLYLLKELNKGVAICAEVPASKPELRKWVQIAPFNEDGDSKFRYLIRSFELKRRWIENEYECDGYEINQVRREADDLASALAIADEMLPGPVEWTSWRDNDCPV